MYKKDIEAAAGFFFEPGAVDAAYDTVAQAWCEFHGPWCNPDQLVQSAQQGGGQYYLSAPSTCLCGGCFDLSIHPSSKFLSFFLSFFLFLLQEDSGVYKVHDLGTLSTHFLATLPL